MPEGHAQENFWDLVLASSWENIIGKRKPTSRPDFLKQNGDSEVARSGPPASGSAVVSGPAVASGTAVASGPGVAAAAAPAKVGGPQRWSIHIPESEARSPPEGYVG